MVEDSGTSVRPHQLRRLNEPKPIEVQAHHENPAAIKQDKGWIEVVRIDDTWEINDHWWRPDEIHRIYFKTVLSTGVIRTIFFDQIGKSWFDQSY